MYPIVPPPIGDIGAFSWPRMLQKWLDVNRITKLTRTSTYITLPIFTQSSNTWNGYSDIVESFNFEGPNNISLAAFSGEIPLNPNYVLCVSYNVNNIVTRYLLWNATGSKLSQNITPYVGQPLLKNFRLEVWNTSQGICSQSTALQFYTSKLGLVDYRWGTDSTLVNSDTPVTNFSDSSTSTVTSPPLTNLVGWFRGDSGISGPTNAVTAWSNKVNGFDVLNYDGTHTVSQAISASSNGQYCIDLTNGSLSGSGSGGVYTLFNAIFGTSSAMYVVLISKSNVSTSPVLIVTDASANVIASLSLAVGTNKYNVYTPANEISYNPISSQNITLAGTTGIQVFAGSPTNFAANGPAFPNSNFGTAMETWVLGPAPVYVAEILVYTSFSSQSDFNQFLLYLTNRYGAGNNFALPLIFPSNSISTPNTQSLPI